MKQSEYDELAQRFEVADNVLERAESRLNLAQDSLIDAQEDPEGEPHVVQEAQDELEDAHREVDDAQANRDPLREQWLKANESLPEPDEPAEPVKSEAELALEKLSTKMERDNEKRDALTRQIETERNAANFSERYAAIEDRVEGWKVNVNANQNFELHKRRGEGHVHVATFGENEDAEVHRYLCNHGWGYPIRSSR